ncbi:conserved membrane domain protein [Rhodococcus sp. MTM3W5.2]|nr:conserved membrane domain protein [Rhodococcus sp. MTM3W5.2]
MPPGAVSRSTTPPGSRSRSSGPPGRIAWPSGRWSEASSATCCSSFSGPEGLAAANPPRLAAAPGEVEAASMTRAAPSAVSATPSAESVIARLARTGSVTIATRFMG